MMQPPEQPATDTTDAVQLVKSYWSDSEAFPADLQWVNIPVIARALNQRVSGDPNTDFITHSAGFVASHPEPRRALSLGSGFGHVERAARARGHFELIEGIDLAEGAIEGSRRLAAEAGLDGMSYRVGDLNTIELPAATYDAIYAQGSMHHVFMVERLLGEIKKALKPGGIFVLFDYVGPSQLQWPKPVLDLGDGLIGLIPRRYRKNRRSWQVGYKAQVPRLTLESMETADPSEAIRASELVTLVASRFTVEHFRWLGGTLLYPVLVDIAGNLEENDPTAHEVIRGLLAAEDSLIRGGLLPSDHVYMVCRADGDPAPIQTREYRLPLDLHPALTIYPIAGQPGTRAAAETADAGLFAVIWTTGDGCDGELWVAAKGGPEWRIFEGASGTRLVAIGEPAWADPAGLRPLPSEALTADRTPLARPRLTASPNPVPPDSSTTTITWDAGPAEDAQVWVSVNDGPAQLMAASVSGAQEVNWIDPSSSYSFMLYADASRATLLGGVDVQRGPEPIPSLPPGQQYQLRLYAGHGRSRLLRTASLSPLQPGPASCSHEADQPPATSPPARNPDESVLQARANGLRWRREGETQWSAGAIADALACFDRGIAADPDSSELWEARSNALRSLGRHAEALACCQEALARFPDDPGLWRSQCATFEVLARYHEGLDSAVRGLALAPRDPDLLRLHGLMLLKLGRASESLAQSEAAIEIVPNNGHLWNNKADALWELGRPEESLVAFTRSTEVAPWQAYLWKSCGDILWALDRREEAVERLRRGLDLCPGYVPLWLALGNMLWAMGRQQEALDSFSQGVELAPDDPELLTNKGNALWALGRQAEAQACLERARG